MADSTNITEYHTVLTTKAQESTTKATEFLSGFKQLLTDLADIQTRLPSETPTYNLGEEVSELKTFINSYVPNVPGLGLVQGFYDTAPAKITLTPIDFSQISASGIASPAINIPTAPTVTLPVAPIAPTVQNISIPEAPTVTLPTVPTLAPVVVPTFAGMTMPTFSALPPTTSTGVIDQPAAWDEQAYTLPLLQQALSWAEGILTNGGTGLSAFDESRLSQAAKDAAVLGVTNAIQNNGVSFGQRGFTMPPGAALANQRRLIRELAGEESKAGRESAVKMMDLAKASREFALEKAAQFSGIIFNYQAGLAERLLRINTHLADWGVSRYNAEVEAAKLEWDGYKTKAGVFETLVRAEVEKVNAYGKELDATRAMGEINKDQIAIYEAQINAAKAIMGLYESKLRGTEMQAKVQELTMGVFRDQVAIYSETVKAKAVEFSLYSERIKGEGLKIDIYSRQVDAAKSVAMVSKEQADAQLMQQRDQIASYQAEVAAWKAKADNHHENLRAVIQSGDLALRGKSTEYDLWKSKLIGWESFSRLAETKSANDIRHTEVVANQQIEQLKIRVTAEITKLTEQGKLSQSLAQAYIEQAGRILAGVGAIVSKQL